MSIPRSTSLRIGRAILALAAAAALLAAFEAASGLGRAGRETLMLEAWRAFGLAAFAGLFALLAWRPTELPGVLELAIAHKAALTAFALASPDALGARAVLVADGLLTVALVAAYLLLGRHRVGEEGRSSRTSRRIRVPWRDVADLPGGDCRPS